MLSRLCTRTWLPVTVLVSVPFTSVAPIKTSSTSTLLTTAQIIRVVEIDDKEKIRRPYIRQLVTKDLKFPLPHRNPPKSGKVFSATRPATFF